MKSEKPAEASELATEAEVEREPICIAGSDHIVGYMALCNSVLDGLEEAMAFQLMILQHKVAAAYVEHSWKYMQPNVSPQFMGADEDKGIIAAVNVVNCSDDMRFGFHEHIVLCNSMIPNLQVGLHVANVHGRISFWCRRVPIALHGHVV